MTALPPIIALLSISMYALSACGATLPGENYQFCEFQSNSISGENHCKFETGVVFFGEQVPKPKPSTKYQVPEIKLFEKDVFFFS